MKQGKFIKKKRKLKGETFWVWNKEINNIFKRWRFGGSGVS